MDTGNLIDRNSHYPKSPKTRQGKVLLGRIRTCYGMGYVLILGIGLVLCSCPPEHHSMMKLTAASTTLAAQSSHEEYHARALATVCMTCETPNTVAFTFDDGPGLTSMANPSLNLSPVTTTNILHPSDEILAFLANQSVKAVFFFSAWRQLLLTSKPYKDLPYQNRPIDVFKHHPTFFVYGWDMPLSQFTNAVYRTGARFFDVQDPQEFSTNQRGSTPFHNLTQLNIEHRLIGEGISFDFPIAGDDGEDNDTGIVTIHSNYHHDVPFERADEVIARLTKVFGSDPGPMWYLSSKNHFDTFCNYTTPISKMDEVYAPS
uniref:Uncharacterized protein n=1 Tax=Moniliophthora roreri TaxID=221103 RepID=A0A0W0GDB9_MONRR